MIRPDPARLALERHWSAVRGLCGRLVRCPARADELAQETLLVAWTRTGPPDGELARAWLLTIARNLCRNAQRKEANERRKRARLAEEPTPPFLDPLEALLRVERDGWVQEGMRRALDARDRAILELRYREERSDREIEAAFALAGTGARGALQTCRRRLGAALAERRAEFS